MNNNNRGNNRRRGRGNNRQQGGQQTNRIDSRARGNAPQLLEKYRKLAHDAHLNGDRVTEEYYLQFADHYFRVMADQKQRQEESRQPNQPRRDEARQGDYGDDYGGYDDPYGEAPAERQQRNEREPRQYEQRQYEQRQYEPREQRPNDQRSDRGFEQRGGEQTAPAAETATQPVDAEPEGERNVYEPPQNPFVRDNRGARGLKQRKPRGPRREADDEGEQAQGEAVDAPQAAAEPATFDAAALPPAIAPKPTRKRTPKVAQESENPAEQADEAGAEEKPRRRRTRKAASDEAAPQTVEG